MRYLVALGLLLCGLLEAASIPALPRTGVWDPASRLQAQTVQQAQAICEAVQQAGQGQVALAVLPESPQGTPRSYGIRIFETWRLGRAGRNDGVLLLLSLAERRCECILGSDIDAEAWVQRSQVIIDTLILPPMRQGQLDAAVLAGLQGLAEQFFSVRLLRPEDVAVEMSVPVPRPTFHGHGSAPPAPLGNNLWAWVLSLGGGAGGILALRRHLRYRARNCAGCGQALERLAETEDDRYLNSAQRCEEGLGSVDYDVWQCRGCASVQVLAYQAWFTRFHRCERCGTRSSSSQTTVLQAATTHSSGRARVDIRCQHCGFHEEHYRTLPRKTQSRHHHFGGGSGGGGRTRGRGGGGGW